MTHGHFEVNGRRVDVLSYRVEQYDIITVRKQSVETFPFGSTWPARTYGERPVPAWMVSSPACRFPDPPACPSVSRSTRSSPSS